MSLKNTPDTYGSVAKTLHWLIALAVLGLMVMGTFMEDIDDKFLRFQVYSVHKALGITVLTLMIARLGWKLTNLGNPHHNPAHATWEQKLSSLIHWGFYGLLIAMPLSGWLMTGAAGSTINWFGLFPVPNIAEANKDLAHTYRDIHGIVANLIWGALALHIGGVLKHLVIDRDNTLRRMLPVLAALVLLPAAAFAKDEKIPTEWVIDHKLSTLTFETTQEGTAFKGNFKAFDGSIFLDPKKPETGHATIGIELGSVDSANEERDSTLHEKEWFDINTSPTATYTIASFEKGAGDNDYIAHGTLRLRGLERPLDLPFTLKITENGAAKTAHAVGQTNLKRLDFGLGEGKWADPSMIGLDVIVAIDVTATAKP